MLKRLAFVLVAAVSVCVSATLTAQTQTPAPRPAAKPYGPPKTLWGDPDLQGNYTNKYEQGTPFERPAEFEGKTLADISKAELADIIKKRQQRAIDNAPFLSGDPTGTIAGPMEFRDIYEVSKASRPWFVTDPPDGKIPPMVPEAQKRIAAQPRGGSSFSNGVYENYDSLSLYDRCITRGYPSSMLPAIYGDSYQIVQSPGFVAIRIEMIHETRIIPLGGQPHASKGVALDMGDARGHWEGNTLVVETTNFRQRSIYRNGDPKTFKLIERFTPTSKTSLEWSVTVDDPSTWTRPWTFSLPLTVNDDEPLYEYACHEGNYAMKNILSGSRLADAEAAKAVKP
ncbi:MAG TPA: hypothetical protein VFP91_11990 [Vicinamibacterales bacterium]|nr:hypothetical protein [Vicinamibacterales bacterium]